MQLATQRRKKISKRGLELIKFFEGLELTAYLCPAKVPTIGYGHTGSDVTRDDVDKKTITEKEAERLLKQDLRVFEDAVNRNVKVPLNQNEFDALVSWTYNLGETNLINSTMLDELNEGKYELVPSEMMKWVKAGKPKKTLKGLVNRRRAEGLLFMGKDWRDFKDE